MSNIAQFPQTSRIAGGPVDYLTFAVGEQSFAVKAVEVRDVLRRQTLTPVPLAPPQIAGLMNLRGHIVTAIELQAVLGGASVRHETGMNIVVEYRGEPYCFIVDRVGDVVSVSAGEIEPNPGSMRPSLTGLSRGVVKMKDDLIVVLDLDNLFGLSQGWAA